MGVVDAVNEDAGVGGFDSVWENAESAARLTNISLVIKVTHRSVSFV